MNRLFASLRPGIAAAAFAVASVVACLPASAITMAPGGVITTFISLGDVLTAEFLDLDTGDWGAAGVDAVFKVQATEDLGTITTNTVNPPKKSIPNLILSWALNADGSGTLSSLTVTDAFGTVIDPFAELLVSFLTGDVRYLVLTADAVLKDNVNFDVRVEATPVPVPPALLLLGGGIVGLGVLARRRRKGAVGFNSVSSLG